MSGMEGNTLLYMENRLDSRVTYCQFDGNLVGPIHDQQGLEQGGVSSSDCYKLYNNELLNQAQDSKLGINLGGSLVVSAIGQADDTVLVSNDLTKLRHILKITLDYCSKFNVQLNSSKTKLVMIPPPRQSSFVPYNPISINGRVINLVDQAEHVGVIRSIHGNMPNILQRVASFKKAIGSVIACGLAKGHRSNPAASMRILTQRGTPVLMSGLASLVLSPKETSSVDQQLKRTLQNTLKLPAGSHPSPFVYFAAGSLPGTAILHLKQITLFGMICRLPTCEPLNEHAIHVLLTHPSSSKSWFIQVRNLLLLYQLPHPLVLLHQPLAKEAFKRLVKSKITDHWETKLRSEASFLKSLPCFHPQYLSLTSPHKLWTAAGPKPYEVSKARIQLLFLGSLYPCGSRIRHWSLSNPEGFCSFSSCWSQHVVETPEHILLHCPAYLNTRMTMVSLCIQMPCNISLGLVTYFLTSNSTKLMMQFLLDCSAIPDVIISAQNFGDQVYSNLFYLSRTWCFSIHRERLKRLGKWNFR